MVIESNLPILPRIILDTRELNGGLIRAIAMTKRCYFEVEMLDVGDAVLSDRVGIERKAGGASGKDFLASLINDPKIFGQLYDLKNAYDRPILIIEGDNPNEDIRKTLCIERNINPVALRGVLISIEVEMKIPIIWTDSIQETAEYLIHIATVEQLKPEQRYFKSHGKRSHLSPEQQLIYFLTSIPGAKKYQPGIGEFRARMLLERFNTIEGIMAASYEDYLEIPKFGAQTARLLKEFFSRKYKQNAPEKNTLDSDYSATF
jgi:Fanconi anemia group M protein